MIDSIFQLSFRTPCVISNSGIWLFTCIIFLCNYGFVLIWFKIRCFILSSVKPLNVVHLLKKFLLKFASFFADVIQRSVLIEGVLFRARYLGSTQLVCEGQPTKTTRMMQAEEAVSRIKVMHVYIYIYISINPFSCEHWFDYLPKKYTFYLFFWIFKSTYLNDTSIFVFICHYGLFSCFFFISW